MNDPLAEHMGAYGGNSDMSGKGNGCGQGMERYGASSMTGTGFAAPIGHTSGQGTGVNGYPGTYLGSGELTTYK